jgi:hypothetical protein
MNLVNITSPSGGRNWICDPKIAAGVEAAYLKVRGIMGLQKVEQECMVVDFGGMVLQGEKDVTIEAGGIKVVVPVSQFEDLLGTLRSRKASTAVPGAIASFGGWMGYRYIMALETRDALVQEMERMWPEVELEAKAEADRWKNLSRKEDGE